MSLRPQQRHFALEYVIDFNGKQAAIRAGYSPRTAEQQASRLLRSDKVRSLVEQLKQRNQNQPTVAKEYPGHGITINEVMREYGKIAFANISDVVAWSANVTGMRRDPDSGEEALTVANEIVLKDSADLTPEKLAAIAEVKQSSDGALSVKMHSKVQALRALGQHLGAFNHTKPQRSDDEREGKKQRQMREAATAGQNSPWGDLLTGGTTLN